MQLSRERGVLLATWLVFLFFNIGLVAYAHIYQFAMPNLPQTLSNHVFAVYARILGLYGAFLTTMLSVQLARTRARPSRASSVVRATSGRFFTALLVSLAWNAWFVFYVVTFALTDKLDVISLDNTLQELFGRSAWLVSPVLGFYFGSDKS
jgi:hypothetical protein